MDGTVYPVTGVKAAGKEYRVTITGGSTASFNMDGKEIKISGTTIPGLPDTWYEKR